MEQMEENKKLLFRARLLLEEGQSDRAQDILEAIVPDTRSSDGKLRIILGGVTCYTNGGVMLTPSSHPLSF